MGLMTIRGTRDLKQPIMLGAGAVLWILGSAISSGKAAIGIDTRDAALDHGPRLLGIRLAQLVWLLPLSCVLAGDDHPQRIDERALTGTGG